MEKSRFTEKDKNLLKELIKNYFAARGADISSKLEPLSKRLVEIHRQLPEEGIMLNHEKVKALILERGQLEAKRTDIHMTWVKNADEARNKAIKSLTMPKDHAKQEITGKAKKLELKKTFRTIGESDSIAGRLIKIDTNIIAILSQQEALAGAIQNIINFFGTLQELEEILDNVDEAIKEPTLKRLTLSEGELLAFGSLIPNKTLDFEKDFQMNSVQGYRSTRLWLEQFEGQRKITLGGAH